MILGTAPSGANLQPWTFCVVSNENLKERIREIVEDEEQINYSRRQVCLRKYKKNNNSFLRMGAKWVLDVTHLHVNWNKPYITEAPYLIIVMKHVNL